MEAQKIGNLLDQLGVTLEFDGGDMVTDVVILAKIVTSDGSVAVGIGTSESTSWLEQLGLLSAASDIMRANPPQFRQTPEE